MDRLAQIFALQDKLDQKITKSRKIDFDYDTWIQKEILAIISELAEVLDETNFKWWKNTREIKKENLKEELIDVFHFYISLCLKVGITPEDLFEAYQKKNRENILRQDGLSDKDGYAISEA
ncbi:MAG: dUTPase [Peptococcaceae bacterium]